MPLQPLIVLLPKISATGCQRRTLELTDDVVEIRPKWRPSDSGNIFHEHDRGQKFAHGAQCRGELVAAVALGEVLAGKAEGLAWRAAGQNTDPSTQRGPIDCLDVLLVNLASDPRVR